MSEAFVTFVGICTHIRDIRLIPPDDAFSSHDVTQGRYSRTILVDGSLGSRIGDKGIPPHDALLYIPKQFVEELPPEVQRPGLELLDGDAILWRLKGVRMYFANAAQGTMVHKPDYEKLPSLTERSGRLSLDLDPRVVLEGRAAAHFDLFAGEVDAYRDDGAHDAVHVKARVPISSNDRELVIIRNWDQGECRIHLKDAHVGGLLLPPHVFLMNVGVDYDKEIDFLLHYDVTTWSPPAGTNISVGNLRGIRLPNDQERLLLEHIPSGLSIGCSNSNYP